MHNAQFTSFVFVHISKGENRGLTYCRPYDILQSPAGESPTEYTEGAEYMRRKTTTSTEVKNRWNAKTYKRYQVSLRKDEDAELIRAVEKLKERIGPTDFFRLGIETAIKEGK